MRLSLPSITLAAAMLAAPAAFAANPSADHSGSGGSQTFDGVVRSVDRPSLSLTLNDGTQISVATQSMLNGVRSGERVSVLARDASDGYTAYRIRGLG